MEKDVMARQVRYKMRSDNGNWWQNIKKADGSGVYGVIFMAVIVVFHLALVFRMQDWAPIGGDGIFTYTLSNNPYSFDFIDHTYRKFPQDNGWISAHVLRESYIVEEYDDFNYSAVYFHQRLDTHPPLYYFLVHTVCSLFQDTYSNLYPMFVNWFFILMADILVLKLFGSMYGKTYYAMVPFVSFFLLVVVQKLYTLPRMYMMLAFFCLWYLYIHWKLISSEVPRKSHLVQMILCILFGTQTHYYFYVYACSLTVFVMVDLIRKKRFDRLLGYVYSGITGIAVSWILFPWVVWHIFFNQMGKHTSIEPWSVQKLKQYVVFLNEQLFNGRGLLAAGLVAGLCIVGVCRNKARKRQEPELSLFRRLAFASGLVCSVIIYTLDGSNWYYMTPLYFTFVLWISMVLIGTVKRCVPDRADWLIAGLSVMAMAGILSVSGQADFVRERQEQARIRKDFGRIAGEYPDYDCIFIERSQDNLLQNYWFEFGDYDEFKKIPLADYEEYGIRVEELAGRKDDSGLVLYAPLSCGNKQGYQLLADDGDYGIYIIR